MKIKKYKKLTNVGALSKEKSKLTRWFNLYVRLRDMEVTEDGKVYYLCCACGRRVDVTLFSTREIYNGKDHHASHYFNSDKYPAVEYNEDNVNLSCKQCNRRLHGNKDAYEINLMKKIGEDRFANLCVAKQRIWKPGILEIIDLEEEYKRKAKAESERLGIKT